MKGDKDKSAIYLNECRQLDIPVLVPDVNESEMDFAVVHPLGADGEPGPGAIRFGLSAVRNVGEGVVAKIIEARERGRTVRRLLRLLRARRRAGAEQAHDRVADQGGRVRLARPSRARACSFVFEPIIDVMIDRKNREAEGQFDLFSTAEVEVVTDGQSGHAPIPDQEFAKTPAARVREGDARALRVRPPADGRRARAAPPHRRARSTTSRRCARASCARSAASSPRSRRSTPSAATSWPRSCSRTSPPRSR